MRGKKNKNNFYFPFLIEDTFHSVTKRRVSQLLEEKETYMEESVPKQKERTHDQWLSEKALAVTDIQESGTFRYGDSAMLNLFHQ